MSSVGSHPTAAELLAVATAQLEEDVLPELEGRQKFLARVTARALAVVERELTLGGQVAAQIEASARAAGLPASARELARTIRESEVDVDSAALLGHLARTVVARLAIDNPAYPSLVDARDRWPALFEE